MSYYPNANQNLKESDEEEGELRSSDSDQDEIEQVQSNDR